MPSTCRYALPFVHRRRDPNDAGTSGIHLLLLWMCRLRLRRSPLQNFSVSDHCFALCFESSARTGHLRFAPSRLCIFRRSLAFPASVSYLPSAVSPSDRALRPSALASRPLLSVFRLRRVSAFLPSSSPLSFSPAHRPSVPGIRPSPRRDLPLDRLRPTAPLNRRTAKKALFSACFATFLQTFTD